MDVSFYTIVPIIVIVLSFVLFFGMYYLISKIYNAHKTNQIVLKWFLIWIFGLINLVIALIGLGIILTNIF